MANNKAWICQELVDNAENWSLAGNIGLLKHMEQFAENLFRQAEETDKNLNNLLNEVDSTSIQLDLVKNQFLGLQNTQFIESRVYEDDETVNEETAELNDHKLGDAEKRIIIKQAVLDGLNVLDKYYDRINIPESDSELDEPDCSNYVLREKDPYISRPLPYVIGTEEWHTKWHAGLEDSSDEDADEDAARKADDIEDEFSDTDSESNLPIADRRSNLFNGDADVINGNYDELNGNSLSSHTAIGNATFAEQLAAKLGDVLTSSTSQEPFDPEINTRPIQQHVSASLFLPDVLPPPIDEDTPNGGLFTGSGGLFDDLEEDEIVKPPPIHSANHNRKARIPNLFDDDEDDHDDDTFIPSLPSKSQILFDETDEEADIRSDIKKKPPIGGVNVLGGFLPQRQRSSASEMDEKEGSEGESPSKTIEFVPKSIESPSKPQQKRVLSLFDDTDDLFEDDLFTPIVEKVKIKGLSDNDKLPADPHGMPFGDNFMEKSIPGCTKSPDAKIMGLFDDYRVDPPPLKAAKSKSRNLFDESSDDDDDDDDDDIFNPRLPNVNESLDGNSKRELSISSSTVKAERSENIEETCNVSKPKVPITDNKPPSPIMSSPTATSTTPEIQEGNSKNWEKKIPGKLKHNLNLHINVAALMPGAQIMVKPKVDMMDPEVFVEEAECLAKKDALSCNDQRIDHIRSAEVLSEDANQIQVLQSITKNRAKIALKRRPSTRQGRQAALAASKSEEQDDQSQLNQVRADAIESTPNVVKSASLFDDLDEGFVKQDVFSSNVHQQIETHGTPTRKQLIIDEEDVEDAFVPPPLDMPQHAERVERKKISLFEEFDDSDQQDDDLFAQHPPTTRMSDVGNVRVFGNDAAAQVKPPSIEFDKGELTKSFPAASRRGLFDASALDLDDDDLFGENKYTPHPASNEPSKHTSLFADDDDADDDALFGKSSVFGKSQTKIQMGMGKRSLFGDEDDDSDIFASKKPVVSRTSSKMPSRSGTSSAGVKMASTTRPAIDPLAALLEDDY